MKASPVFLSAAVALPCLLNTFSTSFTFLALSSSRQKFAWRSGIYSRQRQLERLRWNKTLITVFSSSRGETEACML
jgi:hypothetical protein